MTGDFSLSEVHTWIGLCLPGIPPHVGGAGGGEGEGEGVELFYENCYSGSVLAVKYRKGWVQLASDNLSTLSILKELMSREAIQKKLAININFSYSPTTIPAFLARLRPKARSFVFSAISRGSDRCAGGAAAA